MPHIALRQRVFLRIYPPLQYPVNFITTCNYHAVRKNKRAKVSESDIEPLTVFACRIDICTAPDIRTKVDTTCLMQFRRGHQFPIPSRNTIWKAKLIHRVNQHRPATILLRRNRDRIRPSTGLLPRFPWQNSWVDHRPQRPIWNAAQLPGQNVNDEIAETVDHHMLLIELRAVIDHSEYAEPTGNS